MQIHFRKRGWIFFPVSIIGWVVTIIYVAISVYTLVAIQKHYNSIYSSLIRFFPYFISFSVVWFWVASNSSDTGTKK